MSASESACVLGSRRSGPLSSRESSKSRRSATTRDSAVAGACAYVMPDLTGHGPHPGASRRSSNGSAVSWCHVTSQLRAADLSNSVARYGTADNPMNAIAIASRAWIVRHGTDRRMLHQVTSPTRPRGNGNVSMVRRRSDVSVARRTPPRIRWPGSLLSGTDFIVRTAWRRCPPHAARQSTGEAASAHLHARPRLNPSVPAVCCTSSTPIRWTWRKDFESPWRDASGRLNCSAIT